MARDEDGQSSNESDERLSFDRREYLKSSGTLALAGMGLGQMGSAEASEGGPQDQSKWQLAFEDTFDAGSLDTSKWTIGYSWGDGRNAVDSAERIVDENVIIGDGQLSLRGTYDGSECLSGAVHTKDKAYFGPGSYWEAKLRMPRRVGFLPAFWAFPNDVDWPPEIDFVELFQENGTREELHTSNHYLHYTSSTEPDDESTHSTVPASYDVGADLTETFHVYGCEWRRGRIVHYVDGAKVAETTDSTVMESLNNGAPYHMLLAIMIDKVGTTDKSESWGETLDVQWVRVWKDASSSSGNDEPPKDEKEHYLYLGSADGGSATYTFYTSGGNIEVDTWEQDDGESDAWVADDGMSAGGEISDGSDGDAFYYDGEITDLEYDGSLATYIDQERVDPETLVADSSPTIDRFTVSRSDRLGDDRMFSVRWAVSGEADELDVVEVVVVDGVSDMNFAVSDASGASASGWKLFQFPIGSTLDVTLKVKDSAGNVTKETKTITL